MSQDSFLTRLIYFLRTVLLIDMVFFAVVASVCLFLGQNTLSQYGQGLVWGGILAFLVGTSSVITSIGLDRSPSIRYGQSVGQEKMAEYARQAMKEENAGNEFLLLMAAVGLVALAAGLLFQGLG
jgi:hypothetical protein